MAQKIRRVVSALLMITALLVTQIPATDVSAARIDVGDYTMDGTTLVKYNGAEASITLPSSVSVIGPEAFSGNTSLQEIIVPNSVGTIDFSAFENCTNLKKVSIGESVRTIGSSAFSGCTKLSEINIPRKTTSIGSAAFAKCSSLSSIDVAGGNEDFVCADGVLYNYDKTELLQYLAGKPTTSFQMPSTVEKIEEYAFWGSSLLTQVTLSSNLKEVPEYAFANCDGLSSVSIPGSVQSIYAYAFGDCANLSTVSIPSSVGYIDENAFASSLNVNVVTVPVSANTATKETDETEGVSGNSISGDVVENSVTGNATGDREYVDFTENVLPGEMGSGKIVGGSVVVLMPLEQPVRGVNVPGMETEDGVAASGSNPMTTTALEDFTILSGTLADYNGSDTDITIPTNVSRIGDRVFYENSQLTNANLPQSLTSIGDFAFARSALSSVYIPEGVTDIGYAAFYHCNTLSDVTIPQSVTSIRLGAFDGTPWLTQWLQAQDKSSGDFLIVGDGILLAYRGQGGNVTIPDTVKRIGAECFKGNASISAIHFPESVIAIGEDAFNGCSSLSELALPESLVTIEDRAFKDCPIEQLTIPQNVTGIGAGAFDATAIGSPMQTVVFDGTTLPLVTYNSTATRLSGESLRTLAFEGVKNAIIKENTEIAPGSVLDHGYAGFRGLVYVISAEPGEGETGALELQKCTQLPDAVTGVVEIDVHAKVNGRDYIMTGVKPDVFDAYKTVEAWSGLRLTGIKILGNASDALNDLISGVNFSSQGGSVNDLHSETTAIFVYSVKDGMSADSGLLTAVIPGNTNSYLLIITGCEDGGTAMNSALAAAYISTGGMNVFTMEITMYDALKMIPITKLATNKMELCMPIPSQFTNTENLHVATVDSNGSPELLASEVVNVNGTPCIRFVASHFSPYAIYELPNAFEGTVSETVSLSGNAAGSGTMQYLTQTLTLKASTVQPKWYVAGVLAIVSVVLFCMKGKKRKKRA